jgi:PAS domain-containing protein
MRAIGEKMINPALQDAQVNARSVLDACPDGLVSLDDDLRIVLFNRSFIALTGLDCDALSGCSIDVLAAQIDRYFVISSVASTLGPDRSCRALLHQAMDCVTPPAGGEGVRRY